VGGFGPQWSGGEAGKGWLPPRLPIVFRVDVGVPLPYAEVDWAGGSLRTRRPDQACAGGGVRGLGGINGGSPMGNGGCCPRLGTLAEAVS
jgi:hypothetical protein